MNKMNKSLDDEEEAAALVPPLQRHVSPPKKGAGDLEQQQQQQADEEDEHGGDEAHHHTKTTTTTTKQTMESSSSAAAGVAAWWRRRAQTQLQLVPTRGVGLVIAGLLVLALLVGGGTTGRWIHLDYTSSSFLLGSGGGGVKQHRWSRHHVPSPEADLVPVPFSCGNDTGSPGTCCRRATTTVQSPSPSPSLPPVASSSSSESKSASKPKSAPPPPPQCPDYFRYIHSDLSPWRKTGITREAVERGRDRAAFRLVVVDGRAYVETYHRVFQTRDTFTQWGIAQLLARYPGRVPDLDLMFNCEDMPEVRAANFAAAPSQAPPLFRYCKDDSTLDIVFPDWSFWGWPEVNIRPWASLLEEMAAETARLPWAEREPYAYWKGNQNVHGERHDLIRCNDSSSGGEGRTHVFWQDWGHANRNAFRDSNLAKQCRYRYKIFVRGRSWSVSEKYILACDSPMLLVTTPFKDFFSRGLVAGRHYWPIDPGYSKCPDIKFAVDWGNTHPEQARWMAEEGSGFVRHDLSMDYVYDYMLHVLTEYASLLRYKPTVPEKAVELCPESVACPAAAHSNKTLWETQALPTAKARAVGKEDLCRLLNRAVGKATPWQSANKGSQQRIVREEPNSRQSSAVGKYRRA